MTLKEIASVSGKPGLYRVLKPTRTGIILETIDEQKKKLVANSNSRVSLLQEISVYTTGEEGSILLENVFKAIKSLKGDKISPMSSDSELFAFLGEVVPEYDTDRVYASDVKKMVLWYNTISKFYPELLEAKSEEVAETETSVKSEKAAKPAKDASAKAPKAAAPKKVDTGKKGGGSTAVKSAKRGA